MTRLSSWLPQKWFALGVFAGILTAEALSVRLAPTLAWLIGGTLFGVAPVGPGRARSPVWIAATMLATGCAAALAHWLVAGAT